jgi:hypothetical protein
MDRHLWNVEFRFFSVRIIFELVNASRPFIPLVIYSAVLPLTNPQNFVYYTVLYRTISLPMGAGVHECGVEFIDSSAFQYLTYNFPHNVNDDSHCVNYPSHILKPFLLLLVGRQSK